MPTQEFVGTVMMPILQKFMVFPEGVYTRESRKITKKRKLMSGSKDILFVIYTIRNNLIAYGFVFVHKFINMSEIHHMTRV